MRCAALLLAMHFVENRSLISCIQLIRLNKRVIVHDEREFSAFNWLFSWLSEKSTRMVQSHWPDAFDCIYTHYTAVASIVVVVMCRPSGSCVACLFNLENAFFNFLRFCSPLYIQTNHFATHFSARQTYSIHKTNNTTKCKKKKVNLESTQPRQLQFCNYSLDSFRLKTMLLRAKSIWPNTEGASRAEQQQQQHKTNILMRK